MSILRKLKCWLGWHEKFEYEDWEKDIGNGLLKRKFSKTWTLRDWIMAVDRTQDLWLRKCKHCGKRL